MAFYAQLYALADTYEVTGLKIHAIDKFGELMKNDWNTPDFIHSLKVIYESTPLNDRGLRDLASKAASQNLDALLKDEEFQEVVSELAEFAKDLLHELSHYVQAFYMDMPSLHDTTA